MKDGGRYKLMRIAPIAFGIACSCCEKDTICLHKKGERW